MKGSDLTGHSGNDEIGTPTWLWNALEMRFEFDLDAAASHENHLQPRYCTAEGTFIDNGAVRLPVSTRDGLTYPWRDRRVFVNPPYSTTLMRAFVEKAIEERNNAHVIVMLVKYDSSTVTGRLLRENFHLEYLPRVQYHYTSAAVAAMVEKWNVENAPKVRPAGWVPPAATFSSVIAIAIPDTIKPR